MSKQALLKDPLTGVYSRAVLNSRLAEELDRARRYEQPLSLLLLDLDHFKSINDAFGHPRGDRVLIEFAQQLALSVRGADSIFRFGGDEFVILLPNTAKDQASNTARRLIETIKAHRYTSSPPLSISLSIGLSAYPEDDSTPEGLFDIADRRHQLAKRLGRGRVISESPLLTSRQEIDAPSRMIEQDQALASVYQFLDTLPANQRSVLQLIGPPGSGKTRLQAEIRKIARLRGYAVQAISSRPSIKSRNYAALFEAQEQLPGLILNPEEAYPGQKLASYLTEKGQSGIIITLDRLSDLDRGTVDYLRELFNSSELPQLGLVYADGEKSGLRKFPNNLPLQETLHLNPLTSAGLRIWLRQSLQWEAPPEFIAWLYEQTQGLPGRVQSALNYLYRQHLLHQNDLGWRFPPELFVINITAALQKPPAPIPTNLPPTLVDIVDRVQELEEIKSSAQNGRLVSLIGPAGCGKTTLALQAASEIVDSFVGGVYFIDLEANWRNENLSALISSALQLPYDLDGNNLEPIANLQNQEMLLVIDHYQTEPDKLAAVQALLDQTSRLHLLVTSRTALNLPGEKIITLSGLEYPPPNADASQARFPACMLFSQAAKKASSGFRLTPDSTGWIAQICRLLEGIPLAIEQAAAWVQTFTGEEIATRIAQSQALQTDQAPAAELRIAHSVMEAFWDLLSANDRQTLYQLTVFTGPFHRVSAQQICGASPFFLDALAAKSLLRKTPQGYYRIPAIQKSFLAGKFSPTAEALSSLQTRHCQTYARFAAQYTAGKDRELSSDAYQTISAEWANFLEAWTWSIAHQMPEQSLQLSAALSSYFRLQGSYQAALQLFGEALEQVDQQAGKDLRSPDSTLLQGDLAQHCGHFAYLAGQYQASQELLSRALEQFTAVNNQAKQADALLALARTDTALNDHAQYLEYLHTSLEIYQKLGDQSGECDVYNRLGIAAANAENYTQAIQHFQQALNYALKQQDTRRTATIFNNLGQLALYQGDLDNAGSHLERSLELAKSINDPALNVSVLDSLGRLAVRTENYPLAADYLHQALLIARRMQSTPLAAEVTISTAEMFGASGRQPAAAALLHFLLEGCTLGSSNQLRVEKLYGKYVQPLPPTQIELVSKLHHGKSLHAVLDEMIEALSETADPTGRPEPLTGGIQQN